VTLTTGRGPFGPDPGGWSEPPSPAPEVYVEPFLRRVRAVVGDRTVVDTERALLVHRRGKPPSFALPPADVHGVASEDEPAAPGFVRVPWTSVDAWFEEEEQYRGHYPRNPYHRVDCLRAVRRLRVELGGVVLVDTTDTIAVHETSLAPKLYVERSAVRVDLLVPSPTTSWCNYKGTASYWSAVIDGATTADVAWSYDDPLAESAPIAGLLSFDPTKATVTEDVVPWPR
jgi:uncharacterized protein (DUF427 family)